jgi:phospholipase/carboxylesterase
VKKLALLLLLLSCQKTPPEPELVSASTPPRAASARAPLIIFLHGYGSNERDLLGLADQLDPRFAVVSLRAPLTLGAERFAWYPVTFSSEGPTHEPLAAERARQRLVRAISELKKRPDIDPEHVFLLGFSQGAILGLSLALSEPDLVNGVVACSGRVLPEVKAARGKRVPGVLLTHGTRDPVVPFKYAGEAGRALSDAGISPEVLAYEAGHEINAAMMNDVVRWLSARLAPSP